MKSLKQRFFCDLCGKQAPKVSTWAEGVYEVNETNVKITIYHREGNSYPEGGSGTITEIDIYPDCFQNKLIPWLESQGATIKQTDWEW